MAHRDGLIVTRPRVLCAVALTMAVACGEQAAQGLADGGQSLVEASVQLPPEVESELPTASETSAEDETDAGAFFGGVTAIEVESPPEAGPPAPPAPLLTCAPFGGPNASKLVDDLEDGNRIIATEDGEWFDVNDGTGGIFEVGVEQIPGGRGESQYALHATGSMNSEWGATLGTAWAGCVFDGSIFRGVHFWARGNGGPVRFHSSVPAVVPTFEGGECTKEDEGLCWDDFTVGFVFDTEWKEYFVPFDSLKQTGWGVKADKYDTTLIHTLQFQTDVNEVFDFWIDDLGFYTDEDRASAETANDAGATSDAGLLDAGPLDAAVPTSHADASTRADAAATDSDAGLATGAESDAATTPSGDASTPKQQPEAG